MQGPLTRRSFLGGAAARRFADLRRTDTSRKVFGTTWASPLYVSCVSSERAFHPQGELAVARAGKSR